MMTLLTRRGIALPLVLGAILCLAVWIGSLSYTMSNSRHRLARTMKLRKAYFLARSALQHFFLKVKTMQRECPEAMNALYQARPEEWGILSEAFVDDVTHIRGSSGSKDHEYKIAKFTIGSQDVRNNEMSVEIVAEGDVEGAGETITRIYKVTR